MDVIGLLKLLYLNSKPHIMVNLAGRKTRFSLQKQALAPVTLKTRLIQRYQ